MAVLVGTTTQPKILASDILLRTCAILHAIYKVSMETKVLVSCASRLAFLEWGDQGDLVVCLGALADTAGRS